MNKLNKVKVCTMIVFIVLMLSNVFATSDSELKNSDVTGTKDNPYIISATPRWWTIHDIVY